MRVPLIWYNMNMVQVFPKEDRNSTKIPTLNVTHLCSMAHMYIRYIATGCSKSIQCAIHYSFLYFHKLQQRIVVCFTFVLVKSLQIVPNGQHGVHYLWFYLQSQDVLTGAV